MRCTPKPIPPSGPAQRGGHCVFTVKGNQKTLRRTLKKLSWKDIPSTSGATSLTTGGECGAPPEAAWAPTWVDFPAAAQVVQVRRTRTTKDRRSAGNNGSASAKRTTVEVVHLVCSLPMGQAQPEQVAAWVRGHWKIDNRLHRVRDVVLDEDHHQLRTANGPENMAALTNLATWPHPTLSRPQCLYRLGHQIPVTTTKTRHQATHPNPHLNRLCRPPDPPLESII